MSDLVLIHLVIIAFLLTNIDNIVVILSVSLIPSSRRSAVISSYLVCTLLLLFILIFIFETTRQMFPMADIHYIGFLPIAMGLYEIIFNAYEKFSLQQKKHVKTLKILSSSFGKQFITNLASQLAVSADSFAFFLPLLLKCRPKEAFVFSGTVLALSIFVALFFFFLNQSIYDWLIF